MKALIHNSSRRLHLSYCIDIVDWALLSYEHIDV